MPLDSVTVPRIVASIQDGQGQRETAIVVGKSVLDEKRTSAIRRVAL